MTTPTEDHWAQLSGADLVAELRRQAERQTHFHYKKGSSLALLRAAGDIVKLTQQIEAQAERIAELERWHDGTWEAADVVGAQAAEIKAQAHEIEALRRWLPSITEEDLT